MSLEKKFGELLAELESIPEIEWSAQLRKLKAEFDRPEKVPVGALVRMSNFAIQTLQWMSEHHPDRVKPYARRNLTWPAEISLTKGDQEPYERLRGEVTKSGHRADFGPIDLGKDLPFELKRRTKAGKMQRVAVRAICNLLWTDRHANARNAHWISLCFEEMEAFQLWKRNHPTKTATDWLVSLGSFTEKNWKKHWREVFARYFDFSHGTADQRRELVSINDINDPAFVESLKEPRLYDGKDDPEIIAITKGQRTERARWGKVKKKLLEKCADMTFKTARIPTLEKMGVSFR